MTDSENNNLSPALSAAVLKDQEKHYVVLPCEVSEFGNFVSGLLGKPQELTGYVSGNFDIGNQEIANIYHLVSARVSQQNEGTLTHFAVAVHYDNGTTITHNDVSKFKDYHPTEDCYPVGVTLSFVYLIKFPSKSSPEKQTVEVSIFSEHDERTVRRHYPHGGVFGYSIKYTDRTWATDMEGLLKNHGNTFVDKPHPIVDAISTYHSEILMFISAAGWSVTVAIWALLLTTYLTPFSTTESLTGAQFTEALKYFAQSTATLGILGIVLVFLQRVSDFHIFAPQYSFIVLVERDAKRRRKKKSRGTKRWIALFATWAGSVTASLVANHLTSSL